MTFFSLHSIALVTSVVVIVRLRLAMVAPIIVTGSVPANSRPRCHRDPSGGVVKEIRITSPSRQPLACYESFVGGQRACTQ
jgi:hypothetical protein